VGTINMTWHFLRAWLPLYLRERHGYTQDQTNDFATAYYIFTDAGALGAGFITLWLARTGMAVHASRRLVFFGCALLPLLCLAVPYLPTGPVLVGVLLVIGFGALGVFPNYYSFSQDLTTRHQGKLTGSLGCCCWLAMAGWQELIGQIVKHTDSYTPAFLIAGLAPTVGFMALLLLWGPAPAAAEPTPAEAEAGPAGPADERVQPVQTGLARADVQAQRS
jgi:ACS family hexuronate transporter-like MFS transporter